MYNSTDICGRTIGYGDRGGVLDFSSLSLPAIYKYFCRVTIQPESTESSSTSGNFVLFHFSGFEVGRTCNDSSITVLDGNGMFMEPIEGTCMINYEVTHVVHIQVKLVYENSDFPYSKGVF